MSGYLSRDAILAAKDIPTEDVAVSEWGGTVLVRGLDGQGRDEWEASTVTTRAGRAVRDTANIRAKLVARCIIDPETREPLFTQRDVDALGRLSGAALDRVWEVACRLSGIGERDAEELEGKSPSQDPAETGSGSLSA